MFQQFIEFMMKMMTMAMGARMVMPVMTQRANCAYHATSSTKAQEILKVGLIPEHSVGEEVACVWLTPSPFYAGTFGKVILEISLTKEDRASVFEATPNNWRYLWWIPPKQVKVYALVTKIEGDMPDRKVHIRLKDGTVRVARSPGAG